VKLEKDIIMRGMSYHSSPRFSVAKEISVNGSLEETVIGSRPFTVILTVRSAVFICGETEATVLVMMVPAYTLAIVS
jgi:hypothetical protein